MALLWLKVQDFIWPDCTLVFPDFQGKLVSHLERKMMAVRTLDYNLRNPSIVCKETKRRKRVSWRWTPSQRKRSKVQRERGSAVTNRTGLLHLPPLQEREGASVRRMRILWQTSLPRTLLRGNFPLPMNATTSLNSTPNLRREIHTSVAILQVANFNLMITSITHNSPDVPTSLTYINKSQIYNSLSIMSIKYVLNPR